jgi:hypothetical protein
VWTVLQGLLPRGMAGTSSSGNTASGWHQHAAAAAAAGGGGGSAGKAVTGAAPTSNGIHHLSSSSTGGSASVPSWDSQLQQLPSGTSEAAVAAWLRMQLAAAAAAAAAGGRGGGCAAAVCSTASGSSSGRSGDGSSEAASGLWLSPTMVVHLRADGDAGLTTSTSSSSSSGWQDGANGVLSTAAGAGGGLTAVDHLLLLLPQLPAKPPSAVAAALQQLPGQFSAAAAGLHWQLPAVALPGLGQSKSTPGQQLTVEWAKPLQVSGPATGRPTLTLPHVQRIPAEATATAGSKSTQWSNQQSNLQLSDLPWLQPAVAACQQWLTPKLDLRTWSVWQSAGLPLGGGVLLSGGGGTGKSAVCQLVGTAAAAGGGVGSSGGAEVLLVSGGPCKLRGLMLRQRAATRINAAAAAVHVAQLHAASHAHVQPPHAVCVQQGCCVNLILDSCSPQHLPAHTLWPLPGCLYCVAAFAVYFMQDASTCMQPSAPGVCSGSFQPCPSMPFLTPINAPTLMLCCRCPAPAWPAAPLRQQPAHWRPLCVACWQPPRGCCCWTTWTCCALHRGRGRRRAVTRWVCAGVWLVTP